MVAELINKYTWTIQTLLRYGDRGLSLEEIQTRWEARWGEEYSRKTFHNHRVAIEEIFNIEISCNRSTNRYFIEHSDDVTDEAANSRWLINTFTVNSLLNLGKERLSGRIGVEDIPSGQKYLTVLMSAMLDNHVIHMSYKRYTQAEANSYDISPYALKESMKRWYLIGYCSQKASIRVYALDRICSIEETEVKFEFPRDFDVDEYFRNCYGVYKDDSVPVEEIYFATTEMEANFLNDLPLHHSQVKVRNVPEEFLPLPQGMTTVFRLKVSPDYSLKQEFCKHMDKLKILAPEPLRKEMGEMVRKMAGMYSD